MVVSRLGIPSWHTCTDVSSNDDAIDDRPEQADDKTQPRGGRHGGSTLDIAVLGRLRNDFQVVFDGPCGRRLASVPRRQHEGRLRHVASERHISVGQLEERGRRAGLCGTSVLWQVCLRRDREQHGLRRYRPRRDDLLHFSRAQMRSKSRIAHTDSREELHRTIFHSGFYRVIMHVMVVSQPYAQQGYRPLLNIYDLIDRVLDKGLVIDANISVALVGIEILVVRARIIVAGIDTFLRYASAMGLSATAPPGTAPVLETQIPEK